MQDKFEFYDVLGVLIPGILVLCATALMFPDLGHYIRSEALPDGFPLISMIALSVFVGYFIQAIASIAERFLFMSWGGRPSDLALDGKLTNRYLGADIASHICENLQKSANSQLNNHALFLIALQQAESSGNNRVPRFNALYAFHRALTVLIAIVLVIYLLSFWGGIASHLDWQRNLLLIIAQLLSFLIFWHRTKQRGIYYAREVLLTAHNRIQSSER